MYDIETGCLKAYESLNYGTRKLIATLFCYGNKIGFVCKFIWFELLAYLCEGGAMSSEEFFIDVFNVSPWKRDDTFGVFRGSNKDYCGQFKLHVCFKVCNLIVQRGYTAFEQD